MLQSLVNGIVQGCTYGLIALGLVICYRGARVVNFAQAEIGGAALFIAWKVSGIGGDTLHLPYFAGALAAIAAALAVGLLFERLVVRPMGDAPRLTVAVATIGLLSLLVAMEFYLNGSSPRSLLPPISGGVDVLGVHVSAVQLLTVAVIVAVASGLTAFLRYTDFGLGVLAAAQDATASRLVGIRVSRVSMFTWGMAALLSVIAALLIQPTIGTISPNGIGLQLFICGLAAALLGGMTSLAGAFLGGILVGVVTDEFQFFNPGNLPGSFTVVLLAVVLGVLIFRPQGLLGKSVARAETV